MRRQIFQKGRDAQDRAIDDFTLKGCYELRTQTDGKMAIMRQNSFGKLWPVSALTLGGGGIGMVWGQTTFDECVATVHEAVAAGINLIDLAPSYGDGRAERVVGEAFGGRLPDGVRVTSKCNLGNPSSEEIEPLLRQSIEGSLGRLRLSKLDLFFLHSNVVPDERCRSTSTHSCSVSRTERNLRSA